MININNLNKNYGTKIILSDVSYKFKDKNFYCILGQSGCGKSTLLNILSGLDTKFSGFISFKGMNYLNEERIRMIRSKYFGYIFQSFNLIENATVFENLIVAINAVSHKEKKIKKSIDNILKKLSIENLSNKLVKNLSGGEKQRVAIARALINNPQVIFADEPTGSLDSKNSENIFSILRDVSKNILVICVTHDENLAKKYADSILKIRDGELCEVNDKQKLDVKKDFDLLTFNKTDEKRFSLKFIFNHSKTLIKERKIRYLISNAFLVFSLLIFGVSCLLGSTIKNSLTSSFENILGENLIILKKKTDNYGIKDYIASSYEEIKYISEDYDDYIDYIGVSYLNNFETFFPDSNTLYNVSVNPHIKINGFNLSNFNEFTYTKDLNKINTYPNISILNDDEIILGMNFPLIKEICLSLNIVKSYESLGSYIQNNDLFVMLKLKNNARGYYDEQLFRVKAVTMDTIPKIYHTNPLFNENLLEENMRFFSSLDLKKEEDLPWILKKIYYIKTSKFQNEFLNKISFDKRYKDQLFDNDSSSYNPKTFNELNPYTNKLYVYSTITDGLNLSTIKELKEILPENIDCYYSTLGGYVNYGMSLFSGFSSSLYTCANERELKDFCDKFSNVKIEEQDNIICPKNISFGNVSKPSEENIKFSSAKNLKIQGNYPSNILEIGISKKMANKLGIKVCGEKISLAFNVSNESLSKYVRKKFNYITLTVSGIIDNDDYCLYQNDLFSLSLFRDLFRVSNFSLSINSVVFELDNKEEKSKILQLNSMLNDYEFVNPIADVEKSIDEILWYLQLILQIYSITIVIFASIILGVICWVNIDELKKEVAMFTLIGYSKNEITKLYFVMNLVNVIICLICSFGGLFSTDFIVRKSFSTLLGVSNNFFFPTISVAVMIIESLCFLLLILLLIRNFISKNDLISCLHK